jgi:AAA family ATP:ADP antiporter
LASFFGDFETFIAVFSFLFHTLLSARLLRWIGPGSALLILPCSLLMGSGVLLFSASVWATVLARGSDLAFRHSVDRASLELLYVPISAAVRARVKSFLDMVVSRSADAMASILLLAVFTVLGLESSQISGPISWLTLSVIGIWIVIAMRLRREYVQTLRSSIERKEVNPEALLRDLARSEAGSLLQGTLQSSDLKSVEHAVGWLRFGAAGVEHAQIAALLAHESGAIRVKAMQVVATRDLPGYGREVRKFLAIEPSVEARWQGLRYLEGEADPRQLGVIEELTKSYDRDLAAVASTFLLSRDPASGL